LEGKKHGLLENKKEKDQKIGGNGKRGKENAVMGRKRETLSGKEKVNKNSKNRWCTRGKNIDKQGH
jgi:hypothetical protein